MNYTQIDRLKSEILLDKNVRQATYGCLWIKLIRLTIGLRWGDLGRAIDPETIFPSGQNHLKHGKNAYQNCNIFYFFFVNLTLFGYECCEKCFRFVFLITRDVIIINVFENLSRAKRCSPLRFLTPYAYKIYSRFYTNVLVVKHITTTHSLLTTKFHPT